MKQTLLLFILVFIVFFSCPIASDTKMVGIDNNIVKESSIGVKVSSGNNSVETSAKDSLILILLYPNITEAVNNYFGEPTQVALYDATVNSITKVNKSFIFRVSVTVPTFHGPHNPPYGLETMTFLIKHGEVVLEEYVHKDIKL